MPSKSKAQQHLFGMIHAFKKGALKLSSLPKSLAHKIRKAASSISGKAAKEFAKTKTKGLPRHVTESINKEFVLPEMTFKDFLIFEHTLLQDITDEEFQILAEHLERIEHDGH